MALVDLGYIPLNSIPRAYLLAEYAAGALCLVDLRVLLQDREALLFQDGKLVCAVNGEFDGVEGAHNVADAAERALLLVDIDLGNLGLATVDRADGSPGDSLFRARVDTDSTTSTPV